MCTQEQKAADSRLQAKQQQTGKAVKHPAGTLWNLPWEGAREIKHWGGF